MINSLNGINSNNVYFSAVKGVGNSVANTVNFKAATVDYSKNNLLDVKFNPKNLIRTELSGKEQKVYSKIVSMLPKNQRPQMDYLLKKGILLNSNSNDNSTVLDNMSKIAQENRFAGLDKGVILSELVNTLTNPFVITQKFGNIPDKQLADIITRNINPIMLASRVRQEQGVNGTSPLISGTYPGFEGYYNYYNIKANGLTNELIYINGLGYAKEKGCSMQGTEDPYVNNLNVLSR